jgi:outer membrane protein OmpA-like peptidoglycan-associated protein
MSQGPRRNPDRIVRVTTSARKKGPPNEGSIMRKLLISTTALSVAISPLSTMPGFAQVLNEDGSVTGPDGAVLCVPSADAACDLDAITQALADAEAARLAEEARALEEAMAAEQQRLEQEAAAEAERLRLEEEAAAEQQRLDQEAAAEAERIRLEEEAAAEQLRLAEEAAAEAERIRLEEEAAAEQLRLAEEAAAEAERLRLEEEAAAEQQRLAEEAAAAAEAAAEEAPADEAPVAEVPAEEAPADEAPLAEVPTEDAPAEEAPLAEVPTEDAPAEEAPVAEVPAEEAPADEAPTAEVPAEVADAPLIDELLLVEPAEGGREAVEDASDLMPEVLPEVMIGALPEGAIDPATGAPLDAEAAAAAAAALAAAQAEIVVTDTGEIVDPAAGLKVAEPEALQLAEPVAAPVVSEAEVESLTQLLTADPTVIDPAAVAAAGLVTAPPAEGMAIAPADADDLIAAVTQTITEDQVRSSSQEFAAAPVALAEGKRSGLSNLEKAGLVVLGALAVGAIIKSNNDRQEEQRRVVSNTGDRVIVLRPDGTYQVLKDDDTVIRRPGSTVRTETFRDGSSRTIVERADGTQVVTIRDATGRVLRRATYDDLGREIVLIDDLAPEEVVIVRDLPRPARRIVISSKDSDAALKRELAAIEAERVGRKFSLRQIREIPEVRSLAAILDVQNVTFASGSAAIAASEARNLADLGALMRDLLEVNPNEVFLVEGHTDATGSAALNLALSDRRAESVALALTEYFDIPPENMVVQGYGETELLVDTQASEPANRRVEVRVITPLMRTAELR